MAPTYSNGQEMVSIYLIKIKITTKFFQISAREWALCQLTVCFEFQSRSDRREEHKSCAPQMVFRRRVTR